MAQDAAERLVAGRWMLHTALRRGPAGVIWRATDLATHHPLAVEELHLPSLPDPAGIGTTGGGAAGTWTTGVGSGEGGADGAGSGGGGSGERGLDGAGSAGLGAGGGGTGDLWQRVAAEVRTAASLDHPGLVHLDDVVVQGGVVYVATELVDALTLDELIARHGPLPVRRVAQLGLELLDALESAHRAGLAHLDLRPANVLVAADGRARLAGVGLSTLRADPLVERATTAFLAPEQVRDDPAGPPADLWALGAILFLAVEGETPFAGDGSKATMAAILSERPRPPELAAQLAPALAALLTKPAGGRPSIPATRRLLEPLTGVEHAEVGHPGGRLLGPGHPGPEHLEAEHPGARLPGAGHPDARHPDARHPPDPVPGPPEGEASRWWDWTPLGVHSLPHRRDLAPFGARYRPRAVTNAMDPLVQRVVLIAGGSVLLALVSFAIAVAVIGDPLGLRSQAVASTAATVPPATAPPTTTAAPTTVSPTTLGALVPPGWFVHTDPATGYQVAVPPGWEVDSDGTRTELRDRSSPTLLRIDWQQDPQADPVTLEQLASQVHAGELDDYSQARLDPAQFKSLPAALLEFTFQDDDETWHALELGVRSPRHHVAMAIYARDRDWGAGWALFEVFKASFVLPAG